MKMKYPKMIMNPAAVIPAILLCLAHLFSASVSAQGLAAPDAEVEKIGSGYIFTEGPAADSEGNVYFSDIPGQRVHKWNHGDGSIALWREDSGGTNGNFFDKDGNLISCEGSARRVTRVTPEGEVTVLAETFNGKKFNSPNDCWVDPKGGIYFTDPRYGGRDNMELDGEHAYYIKPGGEIILVTDDLTRPNGIIGTPDGKTLYIADHGDDRTWVYEIQDDGTLANKKLFCAQGSDGVSLDEKGNLYLTSDRVSIYNSNGILIDAINVPLVPANVTFAGPDRNILFITARTSVFKIQMRVKGAY